MKIAALLISRGADVDRRDSEGRTSLLHAAIMGNREMAAFLISKGADVNAKDNKGYTAMQWAYSGGDKEIVKLLIPEGAYIEEMGNGLFRVVEPVPKRRSAGGYFDFYDFIDNTQRYEGSELSLALTFGDNGSLRYYKGESARFYTFNRGCSSKLEIMIDIPDSLDVPNVVAGDSVMVSFLCSKGSLNYGNIALDIWRISTEEYYDIRQNY